MISAPSSPLMAHRNLNVLDASVRATDRVNLLIDRRSRTRLLHVNQLRRSSQAISANISEGFGRGPGPDRMRYLRMARGEAEETIRHLASNFRAMRITPKEYWSLHNLLVVIVKMLHSLAR